MSEPQDTPHVVRIMRPDGSVKVLRLNDGAPVLPGKAARKTPAKLRRVK